MVIGKVKEVGKVTDCQGAQMFEVEYCKAIRSSGPRIATKPDGPADY